METIEELQDYLVELQQNILVPCKGFPANKSTRARMLWLLAAEGRRKDEIGAALDRCLNKGGKILPLSSEARFLLGIRLVSCIELLDDLEALNLLPAIEEKLRADKTELLYNFLWDSWPTRMEHWWLRFCARLDSDQIWVDPSLPPGG